MKHGETPVRKMLKFEWQSFEDAKPPRNMFVWFLSDGHIFWLKSFTVLGVKDGVALIRCDVTKQTYNATEWSVVGAEIFIYENKASDYQKLEPAIWTRN